MKIQGGHGSLPTPMCPHKIVKNWPPLSSCTKISSLTHSHLCAHADTVFCNKNLDVFSLHVKNLSFLSEKYPNFIPNLTADVFYEHSRRRQKQGENWRRGREKFLQIFFHLRECDFLEILAKIAKSIVMSYKKVFTKKL